MLTVRCSCRCFVTSGRVMSGRRIVSSLRLRLTASASRRMLCSCSFESSCTTRPCSPPGSLPPRPAAWRPAIARRLIPTARARLVELTLVGRSRSGKQIHHCRPGEKTRRSLGRSVRRAGALALRNRLRSWRRASDVGLGLDSTKLKRRTSDGPRGPLMTVRRAAARDGRRRRRLASVFEELHWAWCHRATTAYKKCC